MAHMWCILKIGKLVFGIAYNLRISNCEALSIGKWGRNLNRCLLNFAYHTWFTNTNTHTDTLYHLSDHIWKLHLPSTKKNVHKLENYYVRILVIEKRVKRWKTIVFIHFRMSIITDECMKCTHVHKKTRKRCLKYSKRCWFMMNKGQINDLWILVYDSFGPKNTQRLNNCFATRQRLRDFSSTHNDFVYREIWPWNSCVPTFNIFLIEILLLDTVAVSVCIVNCYGFGKIEWLAMRKMNWLRNSLKSNYLVRGTEYVYSCEFSIGFVLLF